MILVTGATGNTGAAVLRALVEQNAPVRAFVHDPDKLSVPAGVEVAAGDFRDAASMKAALAGVEHAYLVGPAGPDQVELETAFVAAAGRAGLAHLARLSMVGVDQPGAGAVRFGVAHAAMEKVVRASLAGMGLPEWGIDGLKELSDLYETGAAAWASPDVQRLLGHPPRGFADFAADYREAFGG